MLFCRATPSTDSEDSEEEEPPVKKGKGKAVRKRKVKEEVDSSPDRSGEAYKPRPSSSRGGGRNQPAVSSKKTPVKKSPAKAK